MDGKQIRKLINALCERLEGDWLLIGGSLLHFLEIGTRQTLDIDLVPIDKVTNDTLLQAIEVAVEHDLPPESINFAAEYFVKKQKGWKKNIVLMKQTKTMRLFRPNKKLFKNLKLARGTETDKEDVKLFGKNIDE